MKKMLKTPKILGRRNIVLDSFSSGVANTSEEFSRTPEMPFGEVVPEPWMLSQELKGSVAFKQLKCLAHTHSVRHLNKQVDMVSSNMQLIDAEPMALSSFMDKPFTISSKAEKFKGVSGVFRLPHKMEGILPEGMIKTLKIHFFPPCLGTSKRAHAKRMFSFSSRELLSTPAYDNNFAELNVSGGQLSSQA
jgi:hypothetical protein